MPYNPTYLGRVWIAAANTTPRHTPRAAVVVVESAPAPKAGCGARRPPPNRPLKFLPSECILGVSNICNTNAHDVMLKF